MRKIIIALLCFSSVLVYGQKRKKNKKAKVEEVVEFEEAAVEEAAEEVADEYYAEDVAVESANSKYKYNNRYRTSSINNQLDWFYDRNDDSYSKKYGILKNGEILLPNIFSRYDSYSSNSKYILYINGNYGLYDVVEEKWVIPMIYSSLRSIGDGTKTRYRARKNGKSGIVDVENNVIVDFKWEEITTLSGIENYIIVTTGKRPNKKKGVYSITNKKLSIPCEYDQLSKMNGLNLFKVQKSNQADIVDIDNKSIFKNKYEKLTMPFSSRNLFVVKKGQRYGVIDEQENVVVDFKYLSISDSPYQDGSFLAQNEEGKFGCITINGVVTLPFVYDEFTSSSRYDKNVIALKNGKCGIVQVNEGVPYEVATCDYEDITVQKKVFVVKKDGKYGLLNQYGREITKPVYDKINTREYGSYYDKSYVFIAEKDGEMYMLDNTGNRLLSEAKDVIEVIYQKGNRNSSTNFSYLKVKKGKKYAIYDKLGVEILAHTFEEVDFEVDSKIVVSQKGKKAVYDLVNKKYLSEFVYDQIVHKKDNTFIGFKGNEIYDIRISNNALIIKKIN